MGAIDAGSRDRAHGALLRGPGGEETVEHRLERQRLERLGQQWQAGFMHGAADGVAAVGAEDQRRSRAEAPRQPLVQIGSASWRGREGLCGLISVVDVSLNKKTKN